MYIATVRCLGEEYLVELRCLNDFRELMSLTNHFVSDQVRNKITVVKIKPRPDNVIMLRELRSLCES